jgi:hypothetical protein
MKNMTWLWTPLWSLRELSLNKGDLFLFFNSSLELRAAYK